MLDFSQFGGLWRAFLDELFAELRKYGLNQVSILAIPKLVFATYTSGQFMEIQKALSREGSCVLQDKEGASFQLHTPLNYWAHEISCITVILSPTKKKYGFVSVKIVLLNSTNIREEYPDLFDLVSSTHSADITLPSGTHVQFVDE